MRSKLLIGALCVAALVLVAPEAHAQIETGRIAKEVSKVWEFTTDTSTIFQMQVIAFHEKTDIDILVTIPDGDDDGDDPDVVLDSRSGVLQLEQGTVGLEGATEVTITITNVDGPQSRFAFMLSQPSLDAAARIGGNLTYVGEFAPGDRLDDPRLAALQRMVNSRLDAKR